MRLTSRPIWLLVLLAVLIARPVLAAEEISAEVIAVEANGNVTISLPAGAPVAIGDRVLIKGEIPKVGWLAIRTPWKITDVLPGEARAAPDGKVSGMPQVGYRAIVFATAPRDKLSGSATRPSEPTKRYYAGVNDCDRLAAQPYDTQAVAPGVEYGALDAQAVIRACTTAIAEWPDTPRFYAQVVRGYFKAGAMKEAYAAAKAGADRGSAQAMAFLGVLYRIGAHFGRDPVKSLHWFMKSAENGNIAGMVFAASMYLAGEGTAPDAAVAARLFKKAADLGNGQAMSNLGKLYDGGRGVAQNSDQAAELILKAFSLNDGLARSLLLNNPNNLSVETRRRIQERLKSAGYYKGEIDGNFGPATRRALDDYARH